MIYESDRLTSLPDSLGNLSKLTRLVIYENDDLTALPDSLGNLSSLAELVIYENDSPDCFA